MILDIILAIIITCYVGLIVKYHNACITLLVIGFTKSKTVFDVIKFIFDFAFFVFVFLPLLFLGEVVESILGDKDADSDKMAK